MTLKELSGEKFKYYHGEIFNFSVDYKDETILNYQDPTPHYDLLDLDLDCLVASVPAYYENDPTIVNLLIKTYFNGFYAGINQE